MPKKKLVCPCLEISVAAEDDVWREKDGDAVLEMGAQRKRQRLEYTLRLRHGVKGIVAVR